MLDCGMYSKHTDCWSISRDYMMSCLVELIVEGTDEGKGAKGRMSHMYSEQIVKDINMNSCWTQDWPGWRAMANQSSGCKLQETLFVKFKPVVKICQNHLPRGHVEQTLNSMAVETCTLYRSVYACDNI